MAPCAGAAYRSEQMALLARLGHEMVTIDPRIGELLVPRRQRPRPRRRNPDAAVNVREIRRNFDRAIKLPKKLVEELARVTSQARCAWQEASVRRVTSRYFVPGWRRLSPGSRDGSGRCRTSGHPYDALLDEFEPGATTAEVSRLFVALTADLVPLIEAIVGTGRHPDRDWPHREFPVDRAGDLRPGRGGSGRFRLRRRPARHDHASRSVRGMGPGDCRITTRYNPRFFNEAFFGVLHAAGHGLYEQNLLAQHAGTPLGTATSLGIHESQSRLWENQVGRGRPVWQRCFPRAKQTFPAALRRCVARRLAIRHQRCATVVHPCRGRRSNLQSAHHPAIRDRTVASSPVISPPADVPSSWKERFRKTLWYDVRQMTLAGYLQDIHWSFGGIGYFPTYTLGNLYAAQSSWPLPVVNCRAWMTIFARRIRPIERLAHRLKSTATDSRYRATELCRRITGGPIDHRPFISYLRAKYEPLYGL